MKRGFTLIELLVVVLIIGILSAIALPQYQIAVEKSYTAEARSVIRTIAQAREVYKMEHGEYPIQFSLLDIEIPGEDDNDECVITKNWRYCIDVASTDAGRMVSDDSRYYVISWYPKDVIEGYPEHFACNPRASGQMSVIGEKVCRSLGGIRRGGSYNADEYVLP